MNASPMRGDLWWSELPEIGRRPVVVLSRDLAIRSRRRAIVAPCTTNVRPLATDVVLEPGDDPVPRRSAITVDAVQDVSVALLTERMGRLSDMRMQQICAALEVAVDCTY